MDFSRLPLTHRQTIPEDYLDLLGHMNVMWYTHLFDMATWNFVALFGMTSDYHLHSGNGSFALEQHTRYLAEVRAGENVLIYTRLLGRSAKRFHLELILMRPKLRRKLDGRLRRAAGLNVCCARQRCRSGS